MKSLISIRDLQKSFLSVEALKGIDLEIPQGQVTAFFGPNGSGKTTTIKCALNLVDPDHGTVEVLGTSPDKLTPEHWRKIGYVSENQQMPDWMSVRQFLNYCRPMYGDSWDRDFEKKLSDDFALPMETKLKDLSRGQKMKAALLSSLAYRPQLVVLDEPFSGLDALVRQEFIDGLLELTEREGWTVWISSHDIEEVGKLSDRVAILDQGRVDLTEDVADLEARYRKIQVVLQENSKKTESPDPSKLPAHWKHLETSGRRVEFVESQFDEARTMKQIGDVFEGTPKIDIKPMSLREIFVTLAKSYRLNDASESTANPPTTISS